MTTTLEKLGAWSDNFALIGGTLPSKYVYMSPVFGTNKYMLEMERHQQIREVVNAWFLLKNHWISCKNNM